MYDDGHMTQMWVDIDGDGTQDAGTDQVTTYTYGVPKGASAGQSNIASNSLLYTVTYPDSASGTDLVTFAYNALGQEMWKKDQTGSIIETDYDTGGRATHKRATTITGGLASTTPRISSTFNSRSMTELVTQYTSDTVGSGSVVNEVKHTYDGWGNLTQSEQDRDSAVSGGGNQYTISWTYAKATGGRNTIRRTGITLPGGAAYTYDYGAGSSIADNASRVYQIKTSGGTAVATYSYNGVGQVIRTYLEAPDVFYDLDGTTAQTYTDLDRFDRTIGSAWTKDLATDINFYSLTIGYDRNSNIISTTDSVLKAGAGGAANPSHDVKYIIDDLGRVIQAEEGTYSAGSISNKSRDEQWILDVVGNWTRNKVDLDGNGTFTGAGELDDRRTHNVVNELTARDTNNDLSNDYTLTYDAAGNLTNDGVYKNTYDVWGRLVTVKNQSNTTIAEYSYNGLGHRIRFLQDTDSDGDADGLDYTFYLAYDESWRIVASFRHTDSSPKEQFLNHNAGLGGYSGAHGGVGGYIDHVVCRLRDNTNGWTGAADGTLEETTYYCQNWRADVSALVSVAGKLVESIKYSSYGIPTGLPAGDTDSDGDWDATDSGNVTSGSYDIRKDAELDGDADAADATHANSIKSGYQTLGRGFLSAVGNRKTFGGYEKDIYLAEIDHVRNRVFNKVHGRWTKRDPLGYINGMSLIAYINAAPINNLDPFGLAACSCPVVQRGYSHSQPIEDPLLAAGLAGTISPPSQHQICDWACSATCRQSTWLGRQACYGACYAICRATPWATGASSAVCAGVQAFANQDWYQCLSLIINIGDLCGPLPILEWADCLTNVVSTLQLMCDGRLTRTAAMAIITAMDCASISIGCLLGCLMTGGGPQCALGCTTLGPIFEPLIDFSVFIIQQYISNDSCWPVSQIKGCLSLLGRFGIL